MLWELVTLKKPFSALVDLQQFHQEVIVEKKRPPLDVVSINVRLQALLRRGWSSRVSKRPGFKRIYLFLRKTIDEMRETTTTPATNHKSKQRMIVSSAPPNKNRDGGRNKRHPPIELGKLFGKHRSQQTILQLEPIDFTVSTGRSQTSISTTLNRQ